MDNIGTFQCAFCGEMNELFVEPEGGELQVLTEDCTVCCRPNVLHIRQTGGRITIQSEFEG
ncbi:MAG: CPXCG motif-containing cysteine-rich protein [Bacteroidetes bacterium]|nr:CPXCG motif-containing cysteine-rich protein [Bacteroidota bacterium]